MGTWNVLGGYDATLITGPELMRRAGMRAKAEAAKGVTEREALRWVGLGVMLAVVAVQVLTAVL